MNIDTGIRFMDTRFRVAEEVAVHLGGHCNSVQIILKTLDGMPYARPTREMPKQPPEGCVWVADHAENEDMPELLVQAGVIEDDIRDTTMSGYAMIYAYRLTDRILGLTQGACCGKCKKAA